MKIFYNENQVKKVYKVPLEKIRLLCEKWSYNPDLEIIDYPLLDRTVLYKVHTQKYVDGIFAGTILNGFNSQDPKLALMDLYQVSSFVAASKDALINQISCSPTAGFHHATNSFSGKYCIFNGLMVAAKILQEENLATKIGILDLDFHYGDGTDDIIDRLDIKNIFHWGYAKNWVPTANLFFKNLKEGLEQFKQCDIIFYQAGMDMYEKDPNGGLLTVEELRLRDKIVFAFAKANKIPLVWNLAGGYTELEFVTNLHNMTMEECLKVYKP